MTEPWSKHWNATWLAAFAKALRDVPPMYLVAIDQAKRELASERTYGMVVAVRRAGMTVSMGKLGEDFADDLFDRAKKRWDGQHNQYPEYANDLMGQLRFFHVLGLEIESHEHANDLAWRKAAEMRYRDDVTELATVTILRWKKTAKGKAVYNRFVKNTLPLAVQQILFPMGDAAGLTPIGFELEVQDILADLARNAGHEVPDRPGG